MLIQYWLNTHYTLRGIESVLSVVVYAVQCVQMRLIFVSGYNIYMHMLLCVCVCLWFMQGAHLPFSAHIMCARIRAHTDHHTLYRNVVLRFVCT